MNSKKIAPVLVLATSLAVFLMFTGLNVTTWPNAKITQSDILVKSSDLKNVGNDQVTLLIGIWIALLVFGGYLLAHIHFRVLKEETK